MQQTKNIAKKYRQRERVIDRLWIRDLHGKEYRIYTYRLAGQAYKLYERNDGIFTGWTPIHRSPNFEVND